MINSTEILDLEKRYWDAMKSNDIDTAVSLTKFPCIVSGPEGVRRISELEYRKMMESMRGETYKDVEIQNPQVDQLGDDTVLISYSTEINGMKMTDVSTWVRESGKWFCAFHAETKLQ